MPATKPANILRRNMRFLFKAIVVAKWATKTNDWLRFNRQQ